jgi:alkyl hydroperoxide reductase subunit F
MNSATVFDLIVIGGGPAGLSAAVQAIRKRLDVLLIARSLGGKTNQRLQLPGVQPHLVITGEDLVDRFLTEITYLDFLRLSAEVERVLPSPQGYQVVLRDTADDSPAQPVYEARTVIVATGTRPQRLNIPGEQDYQMRGLCYSALTYAQLFIDRTAIVVGDGTLALLSTLELALIAQRVTLVTESPELLQTPLGKRVAAMTTVEVMVGFHPEAVRGDEYARRLVVSNEEGYHVLEADGIFVERGLIPRSECVADRVACEREGWIQVDAYNRTSAPGLFAAGDVTNVHTEQVLIAMGEGAKAALAAHEYLLMQSP